MGREAGQTAPCWSVHPGWGTQVGSAQGTQPCPGLWASQGLRSLAMGEVSMASDGVLHRSAPSPLPHFGTDLPSSGRARPTALCGVAPSQHSWSRWPVSLQSAQVRHLGPSEVRRGSGPHAGQGPGQASSVLCGAAPPTPTLSCPRVSSHCFLCPHPPAIIPS